MKTEQLLTALSMILLLTWVFSSLQAYESFCASSVVAPPVEWTKTYGGFGYSEAHSVQQTFDGGYALFGVCLMSGWLVKVDSKGAMQWNKTFSKSGHEVKIMEGQQTSDGGFLLAGGIPSVEIVNGSGYADAIMIKIDEAGNVQWEKIYGGSGHQYAFSTQQTNDGGYVFGGVWTPSGVNDDDFYLVKTDSSGNVSWSKTYGETTANEYALSVRQTTDGGYILAGVKNRFGESWHDAWVVKTDANGNIVWNNSNLGKGGLCSVKQTSDGGYIVAGDWNERPETGSGQYNKFWLIKLANNGNVQWQTHFSGEDFPHGSAKSVQQTTDDGFIMVGHSGTDIWLIKTDSVGRVIWNTTFEEAGYDKTDVIQTSDRGYAIAGASRVYQNGLSLDMLLIKIMRANPPVVSYTIEPVNPIVGQEVVFNGSASYDLDNDISSYEWDFEDGNITTTSSPVVSHTFSTAGVYNVTLTVTDSEELSSMYAQEITVKVHTLISLSSSSEILYASSPVTFSGTLTDSQGNGIGSVPVSIYNARSSSSQWNLIAEALTDYLGNYDLTWHPSITGTLAIKAEWIGNQTHYGTNNVTDLEVLINPTTISIQLSSYTSTVGLKVAINGSLISNGIGLPNVPVLLSFSVTEGQTWNEISQPVTAFDGSYSAIWMPSATGEYIVKAVWAGNVTIQGAMAFVDFAVVPFDAKNVFSVTSNSTISSLSFESDNQELELVVSGTEGTIGYVKVTIAKSLIADIQVTKVELNGSEIQYTTSSLDNSWLLYFTHPHSTHNIIIRLAAGSSTPFGTPLGSLVLIGIMVMIAAFCFGAGYYIWRKKAHALRPATSKKLIVLQSSQSYQLGEKGSIQSASQAS